MAGLSSGELFLVGFVTIAVVSAPWWPRVGQWVAELVSGERKKKPSGESSAPRP